MVPGLAPRLIPCAQERQSTPSRPRLGFWLQQIRILVIPSSVEIVVGREVVLPSLESCRREEAPRQNCATGVRSREVYPCLFPMVMYAQASLPQPSRSRTHATLATSVCSLPSIQERRAFLTPPSSLSSRRLRLWKSGDFLVVLHRPRGVAMA